MVEHSPERDEEVFEMVKNEPSQLIQTELASELVGIAKKWRAKAMMRAVRIEELEEQIEKMNPFTPAKED
jgi:hypothetical protein